jgi:hypothetical protein
MNDNYRSPAAQRHFVVFWSVVDGHRSPRIGSVDI